MILLFVVGLGFVAHFGLHVKMGASIVAWPAALLQSARDPRTFIGLTGALFTAWLFMFALESLVFAGVWSAIRDALIRQNVRPWRGVLDGALSAFPRALKVRLFVRSAEVCLLGVTIGTLALILAVARASGAWFDSTIAVPSVAAATLLTLAASAAVVSRLTAEVVAAPLFLEDVGLGEAMLRSARTVLDHPIYVYRLFVVAAATLIPPLMVAWACALLQNLALTVPGAEVLAAMLRLAAELCIVAGLAAFSVMLHATFFAYYAWDQALIDTADVMPQRPTVSLEDLLPEEYPNVISLDSVFDDWPEAEILPHRAPPPRSVPPQQPYDLNSILRAEEEE